MERSSSGFRAFKRIRQGDPLSPFLFTLGVDDLSRMLARESKRGAIERFIVGNDRVEVPYLQFVQMRQSYSYLMTIDLSLIHLCWLGCLNLGMGVTITWQNAGLLILIWLIAQ